MSGNLAGIIAIAMWTIANLLITFTGNVPPFLLGFLVMFPGGLIILSWDLTHGHSLKSICNQPLSTYAVTFCGIGGYILLHYIAFKIASPFEVNVIDFTWPLFLVIFATLIFKEVLNPNRLIGLMMGFIGVVLLLSDRIQGFQTEEWLGYGLALTGAMLFGLYGALTRKSHFKHGFIGIVFILIGLFSALIHIGFEVTIWPENLIVWAVIATLAFIRIAYVLWDYGMTHGDTVMLASLSYLLPLFSTLAFISAGHIPLTPLTGFAGLLIVGGCLSVNYSKLQGLLGKKPL